MSKQKTTIRDLLLESMETSKFGKYLKEPTTKKPIKEKEHGAITTGQPLGKNFKGSYECECCGQIVKPLKRFYLTNGYTKLEINVCSASCAETQRGKLY